MHKDTGAGDLVRMRPTQIAAAAEFRHLQETIGLRAAYILMKDNQTIDHGLLWRDTSAGAGGQEHRAAGGQCDLLETVHELPKRPVALCTRLRHHKSVNYQRRAASALNLATQEVDDAL